MTALFSACALLGGTLLICQTLLTVIGLGGDHGFGDEVGGHDFGGHEAGGHEAGSHDAASGQSSTSGQSNSNGHSSSTWFFGIITFRTVVAALTFFGLAGLAAQSNQLATTPSLAIAVAAGFVAMYSVHWMMQQLSRLRTDGSVRIDHAVGMTGTVYLRIPGHLGGVGKIQLNLQNRTVELSAWTERAEIPTGTSVVVTRIVGPDSVEVMTSTVPTPAVMATR